MLDESISVAALTSGTVNGEGLFEVAKLHMIREMGLVGDLDQPRESAAQVALWVLIAVITPDYLPPHVDQTVQAAIQGGAAIDPPTAATMAMWCHATAVRAAWWRKQRKTIVLADVLVRAFERAAEVGGPDVAEHSTRLITLAGCRDMRMRYRPDDDPGIANDLQATLELVERGLAAEPVKPDIRLRGLRLKGRSALTYGRLHADFSSLDSAASALQAAVDLADISDPARSEDTELLHAAVAESQDFRHRRPDGGRRFG
ncbi:hypothetical protein [Actinoplanes sp. NPDC049316]|uniref:hypothetical protein n=1 Tax=Actinoplanes sp. NPDC049316 TaxID=3154727 RepID=UPI0034405FA4